MERRFSVRYDELMAEAEVKPEIFEGVLKRLDEFVKPFAASLKHEAQRQRAAESSVSTRGQMDQIREAVESHRDSAG